MRNGAAPTVAWAQGVVDSQNGFGATVRSDYQCTIKDGKLITVDFIVSR